MIKTKCLKALKVMAKKQSMQHSMSAKQTTDMAVHTLWPTVLLTCKRFTFQACNFYARKRRYIICIYGCGKMQSCPTSYFSLMFFIMSDQNTGYVALTLTT